MGDSKTAVVFDKLSGGHKRFFQYFTLDEMGKLLAEHGFSVIKSEIDKTDGRPEVQWIIILGRKL